MSSAARNVAVRKRETGSAWENILKVHLGRWKPRKSIGVLKYWRRGGNHWGETREESVNAPESRGKMKEHSRKLGSR